MTVGLPDLMLRKLNQQSRIDLALTPQIFRYLIAGRQSILNLVGDDHRNCASGFCCNSGNRQRDVFLKRLIQELYGK